MTYSQLFVFSLFVIGWFACTFMAAVEIYRAFMARSLNERAFAARNAFWNAGFSMLTGIIAMGLARWWLPPQ